jgi:hypothetical protein
MNREEAKLAYADVLTDEQVNVMISKRAYEIYRRRGGEHGRDADDWLQAEAEILELLIEEASRRRRRSEDQSQKTEAETKASDLPDSGDPTEASPSGSAETVDQPQASDPPAKPAKSATRSRKTAALRSSETKASSKKPASKKPPSKSKKPRTKGNSQEDV